jgi:hypothetical protein
MAPGRAGPALVRPAAYPARLAAYPARPGASLAPRRAPRALTVSLPEVTGWTVW